MPIVVRGRQFEEATSTVTVNAHGCSVMLKASVSRDDEVSLVNPRTAEEVTSRVASIGKPEDGKFPIGIEFAAPSPLFWRINFPPDDWTTSAERKRPSAEDYKK